MKRVIVVEDERTLLRELVETFPWDSVGCTVAATAGTVDEGRHLLKGMDVDILITDIKLPDGNGLELIEEGAVQAAIVITGYHEIELAQQALRVGAIDFLLKPLDDEELRRALERAVSHASEGEDETLAVHGDNVGRGGNHGQGVLRGLSRRRGQGGGTLKNPLVHDAVVFIQKNYHLDVSLNEAAHHLGITEGHLAGLFKAETGQTFVQALTAYRMNIAGALLRDSRFLVTEVSRRCGYKDPAYFARVFRRHYQLSPREYRERR